MSYPHLDQQYKHEWQQQHDGNVQGCDQSWTGESTETSHWLVPEQTRRQVNTGQEGWNDGSRNRTDSDLGAVPGHPYSQVVSELRPSVVQLNEGPSHASVYRSVSMSLPDVLYRFSSYGSKYVFEMRHANSRTNLK
jgi:hypothetical protein